MPKPKHRPKPRRAPLTPAQKARQRRRALDRTLYSPASILSGYDLRRSLGDLVRAETEPALREIDRQVGVNRGQGAELGTRAGDYYRQLAAEQQRGLDTQRVLEGRLNENLTGIDREAADRIQGAGVAAQGQVDQDAAQRGQGLSGGAKEALAREMAAQAAGQAKSGQAFRSAGAMQGANYSGLSAATRQASAAKGGELQGSIIARTRANEKELQGKRKDVTDMAGPLRTKLLLQLRQAGFEQLATQLGLDLKSKDLVAEINRAAADRRLAGRRIDATIRGQDLAAETQRRGQDITVRGQDISDENADLNRGAGGGKGGKQGFDYGSGRTRDQRLSSRRAFGQGVGVLRSDPDYRNLLKNPRKFGPRFVAAMEAKLGDPDLALAAVRLALGRPVGRGLTRKIQSTYGFTPGGKKKRRKAKPIPREKGSGQPGTGRPS